MKKHYIIILLVIYLVSFPVFSDNIDVLDNNLGEYLEKGYMNFSVNISLGKITWEHGGTYHYHEILELKKANESDPFNIETCIRLLYLLYEDQLTEDAAELAESCKEHFFNRTDNSSENYIILKALIAIVLEDSGQYANILNSLLGFININSSRYETYETAMILSTKLLNFDLAVKIGDLYVDNFPDYPEAYLKRFDLVFSQNITQWFYLITNQTAEEFISSKETPEINEGNFEEFTKQVLLNINSFFNFDDLEKAANLSPDNYLTNLKLITWKIYMLLSFRAMNFLNANADSGEILDSLFYADTTGLFNIEDYFNRALAVKPAQDIQVYLGLVMYYIFLNNIEQAEIYAQKAVLIRPDLNMAHNAVILCTICPYLNDLSSDLLNEKLNDILFPLYNSKIINAGGEVTDYTYFIGNIISSFFEKGASEQSILINEIDSYIDEIFKLDPQSEWGFIMKGNYYIIQGNYEQAIEWYTKAEASEVNEIKVFLYNNRGIARILSGDMVNGKADLEQALNIKNNNTKTINVMELLGI